MYISNNTLNLNIVLKAGLDKYGTSESNTVNRLVFIAVCVRNFTEACKNYFIFKVRLDTNSKLRSLTV